MPRYKPPDDEIDVKRLEKAEYERGSYESYNGDIPKTGTVLKIRITKMWWTYTKDDDPLIKALAVAEDNEGDLEEFDGLPIWENLTLTEGGKFRWDPFFETFGFTMRDVKSKLYVSADEDNLGAPIERIGDFEPGSDDAIGEVVIKKERFNGQWQAKASDWLSFFDEDEPDEDEDEDEEPEPPRRSRKAPARPARGKAATTHRRARDEDPDEDEPDDEDEEETPKRQRRTTSSRSSSRSSANGSSRTSGRRSASAGVKAGRATSSRTKRDEDDPPF